mmetsp:Transcript_93031/g.260121  ORF Transcript_93031/g.260121 Transcript_93031/m.260121 type:complete len:207 (+) Transcript_93031:383-1003(+)
MPALVCELVLKPSDQARRAPSHPHAAQAEEARHRAAPDLVHRRVLLRDQNGRGHDNGDRRGGQAQVAAMKPPKVEHRADQDVPEHRQFVTQLHRVAQAAMEQDAPDTDTSLQNRNNDRVQFRVVTQHEEQRRHRDGNVRDRVHRLCDPVSRLVVWLTPVELGIGRPPNADLATAILEVLGYSEKIRGRRETKQHRKQSGCEARVHC